MSTLRALLNKLRKKSPPVGHFIRNTLVLSITSYCAMDPFIYYRGCFLAVFLATPVTVAERSKGCTAFARSETGIVGSNPTQGIDVWYVCWFFCVCVVLCLGRGLATSWSPVRGVLPSMNDQETEKSALCSKVGASSQIGAKKKKKILSHHTARL
jgi:hypothetical protein